VVKEGEELILRIDFEKHPMPPSIEDDPQTMGRVVEYLTQLSGVTKIMFFFFFYYE
jgi:hypothetical protein